jgi:hypothetical protein
MPDLAFFFLNFSAGLPINLFVFSGDLPAENPDNSRLFRAPDGPAPVRLAVEQPLPSHLRRRPRTAAGPGRVGKNPLFLKKNPPSGFFWVFWVFCFF